ncbi:MAG: hypothetical protein EOL98_06990 [Negativicutes bacterium]|nr:hypothetical protein [Negativicutes bacterium]
MGLDLSKTHTSPLEQFGFSFERGGAHNARTLMFEELQEVLLRISDASVRKDDYRCAIIEKNCLSKKSGRTRFLTYRHLADLYSLDPETTIFRILLHFWERDPSARASLAFLCAYVRDPLLRMATPFLFDHAVDAIVKREKLEEFIDALEPDRFSAATLKSLAQNINSTWTQVGFLTGRVRKIRSQPPVTPGTTAYALLLGYLKGLRGMALFESEYVNLLDCPLEPALDSAAEASRRGWIVFKRVGNVVEVLFPNLLTDEEMELLREQG